MYTHSPDPSKQYAILRKIRGSRDQAIPILVPRALLTRGATRGSGQIHNRIPQKHGKKTMSGVRTSQSDASSECGFGQSPSSHRA